MGGFRKKSASKRARRKSPAITELWIGASIRTNGLTWPSAVLPSQQTMELSIFWLELITLNSTIPMLIFKGKWWTYRPARTTRLELYWCARRKGSVRARSHVIRTLFTREPLWKEKKKILLRRRQQPKEILGNRKIRHGPRRQTCTHRRRETGFK